MATPQVPSKSMLSFFQTPAGAALLLLRDDQVLNLIVGSLRKNFFLDEFVLSAIRPAFNDFVRVCGLPDLILTDQS
jgi:hypothetical protein